MMVSLRDPLRDVMLFAPFAQGVAAGVLVLLAATFVDLERSVLPRLSYVPLVAALVLSALLVTVGSGPAGSDARVNLFGVQPVDAIRLLVTLFLAGYFARRWEVLRELEGHRTRHGRLVAHAAAASPPGPDPRASAASPLSWSRSSCRRTSARR